jgi:hypothetical protein
MRTSDRRATAPTGIRRVRALWRGSDLDSSTRWADPLGAPLADGDPAGLPHRRARVLPPPVA